MAGDWIKMRDNLWSDPRVTRLCDIVEKGKATVIGGLYWLWSNADQHSVDGALPALTLKGIDRETGIRGFGKALTDPKVRWLEDGPDGVTIPRFDEHNGASAKERAEGQKRKANYRARTGQVSKESRDKGPADDGTSVPQQTGQTRDNCEAREEKRREELKPPSNTTPATGCSIGPAEPPAGAAPADAGQDEPQPQAVPRAEVEAHVDRLRAGLPVGSGAYDTAAILWATLHANGCKGTAQHPAVIEMARQGVSVEQLKAAILEARKSQEGPLNPAYLAAIVERMKAEPPRNGKAAAWATDEHACEVKARELGLKAKPGESWNDLRSRIRETIAQKAQASVQ